MTFFCVEIWRRIIYSFYKEKYSILNTYCLMLDHSKSQVFHFAHPVFLELALSYMYEWMNLYVYIYAHSDL